MIQKLFILLLILLTLTSCGPIYKDVYDYYPPEDGEGRYCISTCDSLKSQCLDNCHAQEQNCELKLKELDESRANTCYRKKEYCIKNPSDIECINYQLQSCERKHSYYSECSNGNCDYNCNSRYNQCFTNCGGFIQKRKVCIYGCKNAY